MSQCALQKLLKRRRDNPHIPSCLSVRAHSGKPPKGLVLTYPAHDVSGKSPPSPSHRLAPEFPDIQSPEQPRSPRTKSNPPPQSKPSLHSTRNPPSNEAGGSSEVANEGILRLRHLPHNLRRQARPSAGAEQAPRCCCPSQQKEHGICGQCVVVEKGQQRHCTVSQCQWLRGSAAFRRGSYRWKAT
jgi:hypothetical protein